MGEEKLTLVTDSRGRGLVSWKTTDVCWRNRPIGIDAKTVAAGLVYLVDTGLEQSDSTQREARRPAGSPVDLEGVR